MMAVSYTHLDVYKRQELMSIVNSYVFKMGTDIKYNLDHELALLGTVITYDPLEKYQADEKYGCARVDELEENKSCSIIGLSLIHIWKRQGITEIF